MKKIRKSLRSGSALILALLFILSCVSFAAASPGVPPLFTLDAGQLAAVAEEARVTAVSVLEATGGSAVSISLGNAAGPLWSAQYGLADKAAQKAPDAETMFGIGSTSKMFATVAAMILAERGYIDLDAPFVRYCPDFKMASPGYEKITVRMLLDHSAGFPGTDYRNVIGRSPVDSYHMQVMATLADSRLKHEPGWMNVYANDGFTLIERLVKACTGMDYADFISKEIIQPLKMRDTAFPLARFPDGAYAKTYSGAVPETQEFVGALASGGIYSTPSDLSRFAAIFMDQNAGGGAPILSSESVNAMAEDRTLGTFNPLGSNFLRYGLGWDSVAEEGLATLGERALVKGGDTDSYGASLIVLPRAGLSVAVLGASGIHSDMAEAIAQRILARALLATGRIAAMPAEAAAAASARASISDDLRRNVPGVYTSCAGTGRIAVSPDGILSFQSLRAGAWVDSPLKYSLGQDGWFSVVIDGVEATGLSWIRADGREYLAMRRSGINGWYSTVQISAQKLEPAPPLSAAWRARLGKAWLPVNFSSADDYMGPGKDPRAWLNGAEGTDGYVFCTTADGIMTTRPPAIGGDIESDSFILIPKANGRDLYDVNVVRRGDEEWLRLSSVIYRPLDNVPQAAHGATVVGIGPEGYAEWLCLPANTSYQPSDIQGAGAVKLYDGKFVQMDAGAPAALNDGGYLAIFGKPNDKILVSVRGGAIPAQLEKAVTIARESLARDLASETAGSAAVAIIDQGKLVYSEGFGLADRERAAQAKGDTLFNIGSVSKAFCASAIMALVDEGKVGLDEKVVRYLPEFAMADLRYSDITVRMLLNHSSGISGTNWENGMGFEPDPAYGEATLRKLAGQSLKFAPGEFAAYCNDGFTLAELVVERVSGLSFIEYVEEKVLAPLGLARTGLSIGLRDDAPAALYYEPGTGKREPAEVVSILGAGGMASTAEDLCRFAYSFSGQGKQFLSGESLGEMLKAQPSSAKRLNDSAGWPYGIGWDLVEKSPFKEAGVKVLGKGGNTGRYTTQILVAPDHGIAVAIVESAAAAPAAVTAFGMLQAALEGKGLMPPAAEPAASVEAAAHAVPAAQAAPHQPIPREYKEYEGYYAATGYVIKVGFDFTRDELNLVILLQGQEMSRPAGHYQDGAFISSGGDRIRFEKVNGICCFITETIFGREVAAQKLEALPNPRTLSAEVAGRLWLRRNISRFEGRSMALFNPFVVSNPVPTLPGYVDFDGIKEITSPTTAKFAATFVRDQTELALSERDGQTWAWTSYKLMSPADEAPRLARGFSAITIGREGLNEWLVADEAAALRYTMPDRARVRVYTPALSPAYDSAIDSGEIKLEKGSLIQLAGAAGDRFSLTAAGADSWTLGDTMAMWDFYDADISPDGNKIVFTASTSMSGGKPINPVQRVFVADVDGKNPSPITGADCPCFHAQWSPDGRWVSFISLRSGKPELWLAPAGGGEAFQLSHVQTAVYAYRWSRDSSFIGYIDPDPGAPEEPRIVDEREKMVRLWTVPIQGGADGSRKARRITSGNFSVSAWDYSPDGKSAVIVRQDRLLPVYEYPAAISLIDLKTGAMKDIVPPVERGCYNKVSYSPDGAWIAYSTSHSFFTLMDVSIVPSGGGASLVLAKDQSQGALLDTIGLLGWSSDGAYLYYSNARGTKAAIIAQPAFGGQARDLFTEGYIAGGKMSSAGNAVVLICENADSPPEVWAAALSGGDALHPRKVTSFNAAIPEAKLWRTEVVRWTASDGLPMEGILTCPAGQAPAGGYPLIVEAHGGPSYSFFEYYPGGKSWMISPAGALAYQGFALFRPNIRGSAGYGPEFTYANLADWGGGDFRDIMEGVGVLVDRGIADLKRLAIMGQSYGGYMAAWAVTQTDAFRAGIVVDGITDLVSDAFTTDIPHYMADNLGGFAWENPEIYRARSPIANVRNAVTPTLILHGENDLRVPLGQAQEFYTALKILKVPARLVIYPRAGHYPGEPAQQMDVWERETEWLLACLGTPTATPIK